MSAGTLVVAAMAAEVAPLVRALGAIKVRDAGLPKPAMLWRAPGGAVEVLVTGDGARLAREGISAWGTDRTADRVLVVGVSGGLTPDLKTGDLVLCHKLVALGLETQAAPDASWQPPGDSIRNATLVTSPHIATTKAKKSALIAALPEHLRDGSAAVDLETAVYGAWAQGTGIQWTALRAISDPLDHDMPVDFERFRSGATPKDLGPVERGRVIAHLITHPHRIPSCLALQRTVRRCALALAPIAQQMLEL